MCELTSVCICLQYCYREFDSLFCLGKMFNLKCLKLRHINHVNTDTHLHTPTHTHTQTCTCTYTHARAHTHTHTHTERERERERERESNIHERLFMYVCVCSSVDCALSVSVVRLSLLTRLVSVCVITGVGDEVGILQTCRRRYSSMYCWCSMHIVHVITGLANC